MNSRPVYLIHGWALGPEIWKPFIKRLAIKKEIKGNITTIPLPGYGPKESDVERNMNIDQIVDRISEHIANGAVLVGWSLGGMVAIRLAEKIAEQISALILLASTPCFVKIPDWPYGVDENRLQAIAENLNKDKLTVIQTFIGEMALGDAAPRNTIRTLQNHINRNLPNTNALIDGLNILAKEDLRENLKRIDCSIGMVFGKNDQLVSYSTAKAVKEICPGIKMITVEEAGHAPFISQTEKTAEAIESLIN